MAKKSPLKIDGIAGSELRDIQGEVLSVEGADISALEAGAGLLNDNHGKGFFNSIGRVTGAKKIFKKEDCETERHTYFWEKIKAPYIYFSGVLHDDAEHPNAMAAAAILRNIHKSDCPLKIKASVEGGVVSRGVREPSYLAKTKIHSVALTFTPANRATLVEPISMDKSEHAEALDSSLIKSVMHLAIEDRNIPSFRHVTRHAGANKIYDNLLYIHDELVKAGESPIDIPNINSIIRHAITEKVNNNIEKIHTILSKTTDEYRRGDAHPKWLTDHADVVPKNHPHFNAAVKYIGQVHRVHPLESRRLYDRYISGSGSYVKGDEKKASIDLGNLLEDLCKALTAGYGGAAGGLNSIGGAVIMPESLEGNPKNKKKNKIMCEDCGDKQHYAKFQTKCRACNKSFKLAQLIDFI